MSFSKLRSAIDGDYHVRKESGGERFYKHNFFKNYANIVRNEKNSEGLSRILFFTHETRSSPTRYSFHGEDVKFIMKLGEFRGLEMDIEDVHGIPSIHVCESIFFRIATFVVTKAREKLVTVYSRSTATGRWELESELSPGDLSELGDFIKGDKDQDSFGYPRQMLLVYDKQNSQDTSPVFYGVARCTTLNESEILWFQLSDKKNFDFLETLMNQLNVREVLLTQRLKKKYENGVYKNLKDKLDECCKTVRIVKLVKKGALETTRRLIDEGEFMTFQNQNRNGSLDLVLQCVATLSREQDLEGDNLRGFMNLREHKMNNYMKLDNTALHALNILPSHGEVNKDASLAGLMKHTMTRMGDRRLMNWIRQPLVNVADIERRQALVKLFYFRKPGKFEGEEHGEDEDEEEEGDGLDQERCELVKKILRGCPDLDSFVSKIMGGRGTLKDMCKVYQFVTQTAKFYYLFRRVKKQHPVYMERSDAWKTIQGDLSQFENLVEHCMDIKRLEENEYYISSEFAAELGEDHKKMKKCEKKMKQKMDRLCDNLDIENTGENRKRITMAKGQEEEYGKCLRISGKREREAFNKMRRGERERLGIEEIKQTKNMLLFTSDKIKKYAIRLYELDERYKEKQKIHADKVLNVCKSYHQPFCSLIEEVALLDIVRNFAVLSRDNDWVVPTIRPREQQEIRIQNGRHPCVEKTLVGVGGFMKNSLHLRNHEEKSFGEAGPRLIIITGPNMGGKSTYIRQNALIVLMAQIGCYVPADAATISVRDGIYARIGANDSQFDGVSTFMAEMVEANVILKNATEYSLLVIDELGRGTSTYEGLSIARAICEYVLDKTKCFCMFATHFHKLAELETDRMKKGEDSVKNFKVGHIPGDDRIILSYNVQPGFCGESFGIEVTKKCNYPPVVIRKAESIVQRMKTTSDILRMGGDESEKRRKRVKREADELKRSVLRDFGTALASDDDDMKITNTVLVLRNRIKKFIEDKENDDGVKKHLRNWIKNQRID